MATRYGTAIRVNAIAPGFMLTDQNRFLLVDEKSGGFTERTIQILQHVPMQRLGEPDDMAGICVFFASDASRLISGQLVGVNGGSRISIGLLTYLWQHNHEVVEKIKAGEL